MSDTPMTDLYLGKAWHLEFGAGGNVYHGYQYHSKRYSENVQCGMPAGDDKYHTLCERDTPWEHITGAVIAYHEKDISPVRRPCKLCLAALRKAKEASNESTA